MKTAGSNGDSLHRTRLRREVGDDGAAIRKLRFFNGEVFTPETVIQLIQQGAAHDAFAASFDLQAEATDELFADRTPGALPHMPDIDWAFLLPGKGRHSPAHAPDFVLDLRRTIRVESEAQGIILLF